jgi:anthranilate phosphoribosyltransferase
MLKSLIAQLREAKPLNDDQVVQAVEQLIDETVEVGAKADFLTALASKGETPGEIAAFARALRGRCVRPVVEESLRSREILDVVGTGGDRLSTFNISTTVALVAAAAGVTVAKHGNRASTSLVGSADVMEALGIPFDLGAEQAGKALSRDGFAFFFAPKYHPAFKHIGPARRMCAERGQPTIFNFLGPLLNPACPSAMLIGVARPELCQPLAEVLQSLGVRRAMVVCGAVPGGNGAPNRYLDEVSPLGPTAVAAFFPGQSLRSYTLSLEGLPLQPMVLEDLRGGGREVNAGIIRSILRGEERGPKRDAVLLNAAAAFVVAGRVETLPAGWQLADEVLGQGAALRKLESLAASRA